MNSLTEYCGEAGRLELLTEWDTLKNGALTPDEVSYGSKRKVWWLCPKGHSWQAMVKARTAGAGCPVCANRTLVRGENDLATVRPEVAEQWHPTLNGELTAADVLPGSRRKVWWRCDRGHEWQAAVGSRARGAGCPVCTGRAVEAGENDLASAFPHLAQQWHPALNGALGPNEVTAYSSRKVWWQCEKGHMWRAAVCARTMLGSGCPICSGRRVLPGFNDLETLEPELARQWHPTLNGGVTPAMVTAGARRKAWWQCPQGHVWQAAVFSRAGPAKSGCPICAGRYRTPRRGGVPLCQRSGNIAPGAAP